MNTLPWLDYYLTDAFFKLILNYTAHFWITGLLLISFFGFLPTESRYDWLNRINHFGDYFQTWFLFMGVVSIALFYMAQSWSNAKFMHINKFDLSPDTALVSIKDGVISCRDDETWKGNQMILATPDSGDLKGYFVYQWKPKKEETE